MKVALFNLIYRRYHKANEADSYTNVTLHRNVFFPCGEKVIFESDGELSSVKEQNVFLFNSQRFAAVWFQRIELIAAKD